jgi:hypothetical protein
VVALALQSRVMVFALAGMGVIASFAARHPFDYLWNHGIRRLVDAPALPPNPARRPTSQKAERRGPTHRVATPALDRRSTRRRER